MNKKNELQKMLVENQRTVTGDELFTLLKTYKIYEGNEITLTQRHKQMFKSCVAEGKYDLSKYDENASNMTKTKTPIDIEAKVRKEVDKFVEQGKALGYDIKYTLTKI